MDRPAVLKFRLRHPLPDDASAPLLPAWPRHPLPRNNFWPVVGPAGSRRGPAWWSRPDTTIWSGGAPPSDLAHAAPVAIGQVKHVAKQAKAYLDERFASIGGSGPEIGNLLGTFSNTTQDAAPATVGQVKFVAAPFYRRLNVMGVDVRPALLAHVPAAEVATFTQVLAQQSRPYFPWNPSAPAEQNAAPATIGQLKFVFSFDLAEPLAFLPVVAGTLDSDGDLLPDFWERSYGTNPTIADQGADADEDGLTNAAEVFAASRTLPNNPDSDNDYAPDKEEIGADPRIEVSSPERQISADQALLYCRHTQADVVDFSPTGGDPATAMHGALIAAEVAPGSPKPGLSRACILRCQAWPARWPFLRSPPTICP